MGLAMLALVISWEKQVPRHGEPFRGLSRRRRLLTLLAAPAGAVLCVLSVLGLIYAPEQPDDGGYGYVLVILTLVGAACAFGYLLILAVTRTARSLRLDKDERA